MKPGVKRQQFHEPCLKNYFSSHCATAPRRPGPTFIRDPRSHSDTPHSVRLLWTSDQPETNTYIPDNIQHSQETNIRDPDGIGTSNPSKQAVAEPRFRKRKHWVRLLKNYCCYYYVA